jgi:hypothetical protein
MLTLAHVLSIISFQAGIGFKIQERPFPENFYFAVSGKFLATSECREVPDETLSLSSMHHTSHILCSLLSLLV